jgi:hypothetical protein
MHDDVGDNSSSSSSSSSSSEQFESSNLGEFINHLQEMERKAAEREKEKTNLQRYQESGIINLTEDKNGAFTWQPNEKSG